MARALRYVVFGVGVLSLYVLLGDVRSSWAQAAADTAAAPAKPDAPKSKYPEVDEAAKQFQNRDYDGAEKTLDAAVAKHPDLPPGQIFLAQWFAQTNQPFLMRMALEKAILKTPADPESYVILGNIALQERRVTETDMLLSKALQLLAKFDKGDRKKVLEPQTISGLAAVAESREQWATAQEDLEKLLQILPADKDNAAARASAMQRLAAALFQQKKAAESYAKLQEAYKTDPQTALSPEASLGRFYESFGDPANAKKWMNNALSKYPDDLRTRLVVAQWALQTGQVKEAQTHAAKAMQIDPKSLDAKILRGVVALFQKEYKDAEKWFEDAHLQSPGTFAATNNLALALCEQSEEGKVRRALEFADANYRQNPKNGEAASTLGRAWYKAKELDRAEQALRLALQAGNQNPDTLFYMAEVISDRGRKDEAKTLLEFLLKSKGPFSMRPDATQLLEKIRKEVPAKKEKTDGK